MISLLENTMSENPKITNESVATILLRLFNNNSLLAEL